MQYSEAPSLTARLRAAPLADILLWMVGAVASYFILDRAFHGLDQEWDTFAYHLPFAARLAGFCDKACYEFVWWHEDRFAGFPMLATWLQSVVWRVTGKPD